jgi:hypothetical protein
MKDLQTFGGKKMKTHNLNIKALILILVLTITGQSFAHNNSAIDEKKVVKINMKSQLVKFITSTFEMSPEDLNIIKDQLNEASFFLETNGAPEFEFTLTDSNDPESIFVIESPREVPPIEDWMMDEDYLFTETEPIIEDWMYEENYLYTEAEPVIEDWMYEENYLYTEAEPVIEDWMCNENYLNTEATPQIEDWMMNDDYYTFTECCPEIEDWMMEDNYLSGESIPVIEDWMMEDLLSK